jgi:hypothetical protein
VRWGLPARHWIAVVLKSEGVVERREKREEQRDREQE